MYKEDMGYRIKYLRKYVCGYSQRRLAKLVEEDIETIKMLPSLILRISDVLDSFYMYFVKEEYEDEFLYFLDWGTTDHNSILFFKNFTVAFSDAIIKLKLYDRKKHGN